MADPEIKISELDAATQANLTDLLEASQVSGTGWLTKKLSVDQVATVVADSDQIAAVIEASPTDWTDITNKPATFPPTGGPYLPLAGGTLTGPLVAGPVAASAVPGQNWLQAPGIWAVDAGQGAIGAYDTTAGHIGAYIYSNAGSAGIALINNAGGFAGSAMTFSPTAVTVQQPLTGTLGTFSGSIVSTAGVIRAGNPPTTGSVLLNPGAVANSGYIAFLKADNTRVGYIGFYQDRVGYTAELAGTFHAWHGPGPVEWARLSGSATSATYALGVGTEVGIVQLDATGTMYVRPQKAGTFLYLGGGAVNSLFVSSTGLFPAATATMGLGNAANTWGAVWSAAYVVNGPVSNRTVFFDTAGVHRWGVRANNTAEGGSNAGSDYSIDRYSDAGAYIDSPFNINRATGVTNITGAVTGTSITLSGGMTVGVGQRYTFSGRGYIDPLADGLFGLSNIGATAGVRLDVGTTGGTIRVLNGAGGADNAKIRVATPVTATNDDTVATTAYVKANIAAIAASGGTFMAMNNAAWTPAVGVVPFANVITGNSGSWFSTGTNRYTPPAGRYFLYAKVTSFQTTGGSVAMELRKNGTAVVKTNDTFAANAQGSVIVSGTFDANGTDFFDINITSLSGSGYSGSANMNIFQAHPVSAT